MPRFYHAAKTHVADVFADDLAAEDANSQTAVADLPPGIVQLPAEPCPNVSPSTGDPPWRLLEKRRLDPNRSATGDTTYGTTENIVALEDAGIRAFFPLPDFDRRTPYYGPSRFTYDAQRDEYRCPQGQPLPRRNTKYTEAAVLYRADPVICNVCPVKSPCTGSDRGRMIHRSPYADYSVRSQAERNTGDRSRDRRYSTAMSTMTGAAPHSN